MSNSEIVLQMVLNRLEQMYERGTMHPQAVEKLIALGRGCISTEPPSRLTRWRYRILRFLA